MKPIVHLTPDKINSFSCFDHAAELVCHPSFGRSGAGPLRNGIHLNGGRILSGRFHARKTNPCKCFLETDMHKCVLDIEAEWEFENQRTATSDT
ncbi:hypothetical protein [Mesorhizobium qingshengii]|uniref:hypothetical protein n=1 Tax=Mesorhizobium qingshengii TaxID=1165689 RepID=UPI00115FB389|nr:hypothetical protein [Mesorhizobium qingshengii]